MRMYDYVYWFYIGFCCFIEAKDKLCQMRLDLNLHGGSEGFLRGFRVVACEKYLMNSEENKPVTSLRSKGGIPQKNVEFHS